MSIVLLILKIIGILLLTVLGLLVLVASWLLFVPVRYRIRGEVSGNIGIRVRVSWLLHILSFRADYDGKDLKIKTRVLGIPLREKNKPIGAGKKRKAKNPEAEEEKELKEPVKREGDSGKSMEPEEELKEPAKREGDSGKSIEREENPGVGRNEKHCLAGKHGFFQKIRQLPGMIRSKWETLKGKMTGWKETLKGILEEVRNERNREALKTIWNELKFILKRISPKKVQMDASFSLGDPANTGQALGALSIFSFIYRYQVRLCPDFEAERMYFEGTFDIKGTVYGIHALILLVHLFSDKNIRGLIETYHK